MNLLDYRKNVFSQCGEDGVLEKIFEILGIVQGSCVEFGAWDGKHLSNSCHLLLNRNWSGVLIEASTEKFATLKENFKDRPDIIQLNRMVGFEPPDLLDDILVSTKLPRDFDLLSIDIDGNDYHVFDSIALYRPKVVVIEFNPTIPAHVEFVQPRDPALNQGNSLLSTTLLAKRKGYELICCTDWNAFFIEEQYFKRFNILDNTPAALWKYTELLTNLFVLFDGTLKLAGNTSLVWQPGTINEEKIQVVPPEKRVMGGVP